LLTDTKLTGNSCYHRNTSRGARSSQTRPSRFDGDSRRYSLRKSALWSWDLCFTKRSTNIYLRNIVSL